MKYFLQFGLLASLVASCPAWSDPDDSILTTYSENGERQLDFRLGALSQSGQPTQDASLLGLGYGVTDWWFSELYIGYVKSGSDAINFDSAAWQNTFTFTHGDSPVEVGLYTEVEYENDRTAGEQLSFGPLLQTEIGLTRINVNLLFQRNYFAQFSNAMQLGYQWQVRQHIQAPIDVGLQGFGQFGQWDQFAPHDQQSHRLGPAIFGKINLGDDQTINYNAAILFDAFDNTHATTFRFQAVLGF